MTQIIKGPKLITSLRQILEADIIDFNRLNGHWDNPAQAMDTIFSWFNQMAYITIVQITDYDDAPERNDFPRWSHIGCHEKIARRYWNWFKWKHPQARLTLSDQPDFWGEFKEGAFPHFWGDFGKVSSSTFAITQKRMLAHDLWISVLWDDTQVTIEPLVNIVDLLDWW